MATVVANANTRRNSPGSTDADTRHPSRDAPRPTKKPEHALTRRTDEYQLQSERYGRRRPGREPSRKPRRTDAQNGREKESKPMDNSLFRWTIYVRNDNELHAFQTAALICGYSISIFPVDNGGYRIEIFVSKDDQKEARQI